MLVGRILWFKLAFDILLLNRAFRVMNSLASTRFCLEKGRNLWLMCGLLIYPLLDYSSNWFLVCLSIFVWLLIFTFPLLYAIINTPFNKEYDELDFCPIVNLSFFSLRCYNTYFIFYDWLKGQEMKNFVGLDWTLLLISLLWREYILDWYAPLLSI